MVGGLSLTRSWLDAPHLPHLSRRHAHCPKCDIPAALSLVAAHTQGCLSQSDVSVAAARRAFRHST